MTTALHVLQDPPAAVAHLDPEAWAWANRLLVRKAIAEFSHEALLHPHGAGPATQLGWQRWVLKTGDVEYRFDAQLMALRHWRIDAASIQCFDRNELRELSALTFILDFKDMLGIKPDLLPVYLDEISSTLFGAVFKYRKEDALSSQALANADFQVFEHAMTEGHPGFVANNGRLGFDAADYRMYAPEAGATFRLVWLAVRCEMATFASLSTLSYHRLMQEELGDTQLERFAAVLVEQGLNEADYVFMPAHPWQWFDKLSIAFAAHIAKRDIVCLGYGEDHYQPQQSIRTYFNVGHSRRRYVKTSLSIVNMGFMRGLSPDYMLGTPAINEWVHALVEGDPTLHAYGFSILREEASIGFHNRYFEAAVDRGSPYRKMLSCLWRENPLPRLRPGENLMTMTALLHTDREGQALLPVLIERSGLGADEWLRRWLRAYLSPLLHCFYARDLVFMPHCENLILVLANHAPVRVIMKDIAEEASILNKDAKMPGHVQRLVVDVPDDIKLLAIFIDVFDGVFRFVSQILLDSGVYEDEDSFWHLVAECVLAYQGLHPQYSKKFAAYDMFAPAFLHSCLNRLQLVNNLQMVNLADPAQSFQTAGELVNPIAKFRPKAGKPIVEARSVEPAA